MKLVALHAALLLLTACPKERREELEQQHKQVIDQVGGAPKRQLDDVQQRVNATSDKAQERADRAEAVKEDQ